MRAPNNKRTRFRESFLYLFAKNYGYALLERLAQRNPCIAFFALRIIIVNLIVFTFHFQATIAVNNLYIHHAIRLQFKETTILERYSNS